MAGALPGFESGGSYSLVVVVVAASRRSSAMSGRLGYAASDGASGSQVIAPRRAVIRFICCS